MRAQIVRKTYLSMLLVVCGVPVVESAHAGTVTSVSSFETVQTFTITNNGTATAEVDYTLASSTSQPTTPGGGTGSGYREFGGSLDVGSYSGISGETYHIDISAGASHTVTLTSDVTSEASASSPSGSATTITSQVLVSTFLTASSGITLTVVSSPASYMLSVTRDSSPLATGLASFSVVDGGVTVFSDSLTTGSKSVMPLTSTSTVDLAVNTPFTSTAGGVSEAVASVVPEPSTLASALEAAVLVLMGHAWRRRKRAA
jgi:hypothetical protein